MQKIQKIIIVTILIGGVGFVVYSIFLKASTVSAQNTDTGVTTETSATVGQDILDLMAAFQKVSIDSSLFSSSLFQNLKDFSTTIQPETPGRSNPFAPIGSVSGLSNTNTNPSNMYNVKTKK